MSDLPIGAVHQRLEHVVAPPAVAAADESVEQLKLGTHIAQVQQLDGQVKKLEKQGRKRQN
jgi:hypothetical protein